MAQTPERLFEPIGFPADEHRREIRTLIVEEEQLFAEALQSALALEAIVVERIVPPEPGASMAVQDSDPDVVIVGVDAPTPSELVLGETILEASPRARLLILARTMDRSQGLRVMRAGFHGCLSKDASVPRLVRAIRAIAARGAPSRTDRLAHFGADSRGRRQAGLLRPHLTPREYEVLQLIATGAPGRVIARRLGISENTVRTHSQSILVKLQVHSRLEAATLAIRHGLVRLGVHDEASMAG